MNAVLDIAISIDRPAAEVYAFTSDPRNLPLWAAGLARSEVLPDGDAWVARAPYVILEPVNYRYHPGGSPWRPIHRNASPRPRRPA